MNERQLVALSVLCFVTATALILLAVSTAAGADGYQPIEPDKPHEYARLMDTPPGAVCTATFADNGSKHVGNVAVLRSGVTSVVAEDFEQGLGDVHVLMIVSSGTVIAEVDSPTAGGSSTSVTLVCAPATTTTTTAPATTTTTTTVPATTTTTAPPPTTTTPPPPPEDDGCPEGGLACTGPTEHQGLALKWAGLLVATGTLLIHIDTHRKHT